MFTSGMIETASLAFATLFATVGPFDVPVLFAALTAKQDEAYKRAMAIRGTCIAAAILLIFALLGDLLLSTLGISLAALRVAGGILLLLISIDMVFARSSGGTSTTKDETKEASSREDISVFPLATPLIAGPGAMGAVILLMADQTGNIVGQGIVIACLLAVLCITFVALLLASKILAYAGVIGMHVLSRVMGVLLSALAIEFLFAGIRESHLFG